MNLPEFGSRISIVSHAYIRYLGRFYSLDMENEILTLYSVRSFGTEDRVVLLAIPPRTQTFDFVSFRAQDVHDLRVVDNDPYLHDPAIMPTVYEIEVMDTTSDNEGADDQYETATHDGSSTPDVPPAGTTGIEQPVHPRKTPTRSRSATGIFSTILVENQQQQSSANAVSRYAACSVPLNSPKNDAVVGVDKEPLADWRAIYSSSGHRSRSRIPSRGRRLGSYGRNPNQWVSGSEFRDNFININKEKANKSLKNWRTLENLSVRRSWKQAPNPNSVGDRRSQSKGDEPNVVSPDKRNELSKNDWRKMFPQRSLMNARTCRPFKNYGPDLNIKHTCGAGITDACLQNQLHHATMRFDCDFDFEQTTELTLKLSTLEVGDERKEREELDEEMSGIIAYDKKKCFFDNLEPHGAGRIYKNSRSINVETFGEEWTPRRKRGKSYKNMQNSEVNLGNQECYRSGSRIPSKRSNDQKMED